METQAAPQDRDGRAAWMRTLALAHPDELDRLFGGLTGLPEPRMLREPQTGMTMVRARGGGTGAQFNLGEMTVTRCAVALPQGVMGVAYVQGRNARHARQAALLDALMQLPQWRQRLRDDVLEPLERARGERRARRAAQAAATKVEFFTMVRGED